MTLPCVAARVQAGPVGANQDARCSEALKNDVKMDCELRGIPMLPVWLWHYAGDLAVDVMEFRQTPGVFVPGRWPVFLDQRPENVVDDGQLSREELASS